MIILLLDQVNHEIRQPMDLLIPRILSGFTGMEVCESLVFLHFKTSKIFLEQNHLENKQNPFPK